MQIARRSFLFGVGASLIAAPAIVRAASLMPVKSIEPLYGISPAMISLRELQNFNAALWRYHADLGAFGTAILPAGTIITV